MEPSRRLLLSDYDGAVESPLPSPPHSSATPFRPGVAVVVGILTSVFSITFLLLLYAKHCKRSAAESSGPYGGAAGAGGFGSSGAGAAGDRRNSGVDRAVVESLPVFRYGALRGQKEGLECAVCLGRFEPTEALRLLPKCRHGFHVRDVLLLPEPPKPSTTGPPDPPMTKAAKEASPAQPAAPAPSPAAAGRRISGRHSTGSVRAPGRVGPSSRRSADGGVAVGCFDGAKVRKDRVLLVEPAAVVAEPDPEAFDRRFGHRILVSTAGGCEGETAPAAQQRWSDLRPSDLMFVRSEFLVTDAGRYSCSAAVNPGSARSAIGVRSLSELAGVCRLPPIRAGAREGEGEPRPAAGAPRRWRPGSSWWAPRGPPAPGRNGPSAC
ncbi:RING-H2 finger protein ATL43 [Panicum miliaceum]|uniref:RING-H2 finger protein ATL43 n=1 Tax=Panicum miliaceum TaxID=4540 RepID=A0A3L6RX75_PANMI|nr:RING-H2 finger protein ATL43 [Panicum miliaceum]